MKTATLFGMLVQLLFVLVLMSTKTFQCSTSHITHFFFSRHVPRIQTKAFKLSVIITYVTVKCDVYKLLNKDYIYISFRRKQNEISHHI